MPICKAVGVQVETGKSPYKKYEDFEVDAAKEGVELCLTAAAIGACESVATDPSEKVESKASQYLYPGPEYDKVI